MFFLFRLIEHNFSRKTIDIRKSPYMEAVSTHPVGRQLRLLMDGVLWAYPTLKPKRPTLKESRPLILVAGAGWPSPLRGSVGLDGFNPMLRIGPSRLEPASSQVQNVLKAK